MNYEKYLIAEYENWKIYLHENQCYLGRVYIWAKRENALDFFDMNESEKKEYFEIGKKLKNALKKLFAPDLYNYSTLANVAAHLHTHFIPRYKKERKFAGIIFKDEKYGQNYAPHNKDFKVSEEVLIKIKEAISKELNESNKK